MNSFTGVANRLCYHISAQKRGTIHDDEGNGDDPVLGR